MFEERSKIPVEKRNYAVYYVVFSGILFLGTVWSVLDEVRTRRPWKEYQTGYYELAASRLDSLHQLALQEIDSAQVVELRNTLDSALAALQSAEYQAALPEKREFSKDLDIAIREWRFARSRSDAAYYQYQKARLEGRDAAPAKKEVDEHEASVTKFFREKTDLESRISTLDVVINKYKDVVTKAQVELHAMFVKSEGLKTKSQTTLSSPIVIHQVMMNDYELTPFQEIKARIDRCQTCHTGWRDDLMEEAPQPYRKHPAPELLAKHNPESFGCTPCHRGQGPALTPGFAHGDADPHWETPILRGVNVYATCNACHSSESVLKHAKPLVKAKQIVVESGCYGCHEIKGMGELPKIGPPLNSLTSKAQPEWIFRWVRNPKEYNPTTRMPNFKFSDEQAEAITAYLVNIGRQSSFQLERGRGSYTGGSSSQGKLLFESVGCQACHTAGEVATVREARGTTYDIAPELTRVASKVSPDWMFDWVKNPRHYNGETRMPSLRLTDSEARNIVAYLMTLRDSRKLDQPKLDLANAGKIARGDKLIREYGCAGCHAIKGMENEGKVSVELSDFGRKKYEQMDFGNTHELAEHDTVDYRENPDGTVSVRHSWQGWVYGKFKNSRLYQTERIAQKMPVFSFNDEEIRLVRMFLVSMTKDVPLPAYQRPFDKRMQDIEAGRRLTLNYNCIQCHMMEDRGGYFLAKFQEAAQGPPPIPESQGAKVQEQWLHSFLKNPTTIRPWLATRMPTFSLTDNEISKIQKYFLGTSKQEFQLRDYTETVIEQKYLAPGKRLFEIYQCAKCHPSGGSMEGITASFLAPDMAKAYTRLKPEWIFEWMKDPSKLQPGTMMPAFFTPGEPAPDPAILGGVNEEQIKALQAYVWNLGRRAPAVASK
ncbi:MAG: putative octahem cytochrome c [Bacteroidetes bacterium]|nr:putative octahem cytochrome c [Bacteroidota bacterium]